MATVREGNKEVLLVVDVQVAVMAEAWEAARVIGNVAHAVARARAQGVPVIWVRHGDDDLRRDTPSWQLVPELVPAAGETIIDKRFNSSFEQTALEDELARLGATHVVLAGAATNWCIRATAYGALDRGYDLTLLADAHTTETMDLGERKIAAADIVTELNAAVTWLSYPGRANGTAAAGTIDFARPAGAA
jgi:nicotinamidase-related amidase